MRSRSRKRRNWEPRFDERLAHERLGELQINVVIIFWETVTAKIYDRKTKTDDISKGTQNRQITT